MTPAVLLLWGAALAVAVAVGRSADPAAATRFEFLDFPLPAAFMFTLVGGLIVPRQPRNPIGWLFVAIGLANGLAVLGGTYADNRLLAWVGAWSPAVSYGLIPLMLLLLPDGTLLARSFRPAAWFAAGSLGLLVASVAVPAWADPSLGGGSAAEVTLARVGLLATLASMAVALVAVYLRWRRAGGDVRQQLKWLGVGMAFVPVGIVAQILDVPGAWLLAAIALPACSAIAILKYRLYDIDLFLNRSIVYAVLTVLSVGFYVGSVQFASTFFPSWADWERLVATGVVAVAFSPLRTRVQRGVDHLLYGDRDDPYAVVSSLGRSLEQVADPAAVLPRVVETVATALHLPYAAIEAVGGSGPPRLLAGHGRHVGRTVAFTMSYQGTVVGRLLVDPRSPRQPFTSAERRLLEDLARQAALATHAVGLTADLRRSREHLLRSREEERRRLRRDLHDGLGPTLAGMTMQVGAARALLASDPVRVDAVLGELEHQMQACIKEIRHLVDGLRPTALDRLGLLGAIRLQISSFTGNGGVPPVVVTLDTPDDLGELPAAVELAAYRIVSEAITNTVRHAEASRCRVTLTLGADLGIEVSDDGRGLPGDHGPGVGLLSMRERAEELGGTFTARLLPDGGTAIRAELPLGTD